MKYVYPLCVMLACCGAGFCQRVAVVPKAPPEPTTATGSSTLDVMVTDKAGHPIPGLQQQDFTLLDDRHPTAIENFKAYQDTNPQEDSTSILILIDDVNNDFNIVSNERGQIDSYLRRNHGQLPAPVSIAYLTERGFDLVVPPSTDGNLVASVLDQRQGELRDIDRSAGFYGFSEMMQMSIDAFTKMLRYESRVPGRKLVIWISKGWRLFDSPNVVFTDQQERAFFNLVVDLSTGLRQARVVLYAVDPYGLEDAGGFRTFLWQDFLKPVRSPEQAQPGSFALQVFAVHSGGKVLTSSNDIAGEIAQCAQDASAWYRFAFSPARSEKPDTWHDLQVKVDKPKMIVRTSNGYYAQP